MGIGPLQNDGGLQSAARPTKRQGTHALTVETGGESRSLTRLAELADRVVKTEREAAPGEARQDRIEILRQKAASGFYDKPDVVKEIAKKLANDC